MRALVVDDERLARAELRRLLVAHPEVEVVGEARNVDEAQEQLAALTPDLLFLDVQMPGGTGFDLLERLDDVPVVVFTTAYDEYALRAFEVSALDYLVKPVAPERLAAALAKARRAIPAARPAGALQQVFVRDGDRCWLVRLADIALFEAEGNYTRLCFGAERPLVLRSLASLEERLDPAQFFRANRQQMVNLRWVEGVETGVSGNLVLRLRGGSEVELSRRQTLRFRQTMSL